VRELTIIERRTIRDRRPRPHQILQAGHLLSPVRWLRKHWVTRDNIIAWNERSSAEAEQRICLICQMISDILHRIGIGKKRS
jgi:hypothetical protein